MDYRFFSITISHNLNQYVKTLDMHFIGEPLARKEMLAQSRTTMRSKSNGGDGHLNSCVCTIYRVKLQSADLTLPCFTTFSKERGLPLPLLKAKGLMIHNLFNFHRIT